MLSEESGENKAGRKERSERKCAFRILFMEQAQSRAGGQCQQTGDQKSEQQRICAQKESACRGQLDITASESAQT